MSFGMGSIAFKLTIFVKFSEWGQAHSNCFLVFSSDYSSENTLRTLYTKPDEAKYDQYWLEPLTLSLSRVTATQRRLGVVWVGTSA